MPNYEKYSCPVCNKQFEEGDDIVTCPECGTPHHRECYKLAGHCVNQGLHKSGYSFLVQENVKEEASNDYYTPPTENASEQKKAEENDNAKPKSTTIFEISDVDTVYEKDTQQIDGESVADVAATIRTNIPRFINKFKDFEAKNKKASWNWGAFCFGSLYLLFRKMYKQGIAFFCVTVSVVLASDVLIYKFAPEYVSAVQSMMSTYASSGVKSVDTSSIFNASDMQNVVKIVYIALGIIILLRIVQAVFADYFYKGTVTTIIKNVKKQLDDGASFMASPFMMSADMQPIDQNKMRQLYLARKGGVSLLGPIMAYLVLSLIFTFV